MRLELLATLSVPANPATAQGAEHREHLSLPTGVPGVQARNPNAPAGLGAMEHREHQEHRKIDGSAMNAMTAAGGETPERLSAKAESIDLDLLLAEACRGVKGIDAAIFQALLSPADVDDIAGGSIPVPTLRAYARSLADGLRCGRITVLAAATAKPALTQRVRCNACRHFKRDTIGDGAGIGSCAVDGEGAGPGQPCLWPNVERVCRDFEEHL